MNGYRLLGFVVWHAGKWYVRRRLPSRRAALGAGVATLGVVAAAAVVLRRSAT
jgi:hypothetical protein